MTTDQLSGWWETGRVGVLDRLDAGIYRPEAPRRVQIPKPSGGVRVLGVPNVVDRVIAQAIAQVLVPIFDPGFSESSFGFRPGRSAHQAVEAAREMIEDGCRWAVTFDLDSFFDRVNHDMVMARVARKVADKRLLRLIRAFLTSGVMDCGIGADDGERSGTPQGSPLSPLLSNILLDDLDAELEARGHRFVRYADDLRVYVGSERAAGRVLETITAFVEKRLKLKVNRSKSGVGLATAVAVLGFCFYRGGGTVKIRIAPEAKKRLQDRLRRLTSRRWAVTMGRRIGELNTLIRGTTNYYGLADTPGAFEQLDGWLRRRLRQALWHQWKTPQNRAHQLRRLGIPSAQVRDVASSSKSRWRIAHTYPVQQGLSNQYWVDQGLVGFVASYHHTRESLTNRRTR